MILKQATSRRDTLIVALRGRKIISKIIVMFIRDKIIYITYCVHHHSFFTNKSR